MIHPFFEKLFFGLYAGILILALAGVGLYFVLSSDLPQLPAKLENINLSLPTEIYSADGERLKVLGERRPIPFEDISPHFTKAIVAAEDARYFSHSGLDHIGLARALVTNFRARRVIQGGSTITQQLSKNLFFSFERNLIRKIKELLVALQLEATFSKERILEAYCNQIYFGNGAYGVEEASQVYFGRRANNISLLQAAVLAGLPNSPNNANPFTNFDRAMSRAQYVLKRMVDENFITPEERQKALDSDLQMVTPRVLSNPNHYFTNFVIEKLEQDYGKEFVHFGGLKIYTTLNSQYQRYAQRAARSHLEALEEKLPAGMGSKPLQVAVVAIENKSGAVRTMLGGRSYSHSQFNRAVSNNRMPGSSFKPFVYFTAMETLGYSPATVVRDEPLVIDIPGSGPWEPKNFDGEFAGDLILKKALMKSLNVVSARLTQAVTPERVIKTARQFGITSPLGNNMSLGLGTSGVSPLEMASAYSVIANLGTYAQPYFIERIEDFHGKRLYEHYYQGVQRFAQKMIYPLSDMMQGVVDGGTGRVLRRMGFKHPAGGKTGTTNDHKDAWFNGFTKDFSVSVWVGRDNNEAMVGRNGKGFTGSGAAAPIWVFFMQKVLQGKNQVKFPVPAGIKLETVNIRSGWRTEETSMETLQVAVKEEVDLSPPLLEEAGQTAQETEALPTSEDLNVIPIP